MLGWSDGCIAVQPSDFCVPLAALGAVVEIEGKAGKRSVPMTGFHRLPGNEPWRETVLEPGDLVTAVVLPAEAAGFAAHSRYLKVRDRTSYAFAVVSAAAALRMDGDRIAEARLAFGGVALKPWRSAEAEAALKGASPPRSRRSAAPPRPRWPMRNRRATTATRSSSRGASPCGPSRWRSPARPSACPRCRLPRSRLRWESPHMPEQTHTRHGSNVGQPLTRREGVLKVTGTATFAGRQPPRRHAPTRRCAPSTIARGRVSHLDVAAAKAHPGVVDVMVPGDTPGLAFDPDEKDNPFTFKMDVLQNDGVRYATRPSRW